VKRKRKISHSARLERMPKGARDVSLLASERELPDCLTVRDDAAKLDSVLGGEL
jgi:hypothetical protein